VNTVVLFAPLLVTGAIITAVTATHRRIPPHLAARTATCALVIVLAAIVPSLVALAVAYLAHVPALGPTLRWCAHAIGVHDTVPAWLGIPSAVGLAIGGVRAVNVLRDHRHLRRCDHPGDIEIVADRSPLALTLPGPGRRIIVSQGLVELLEPREIDVVLAHERAHARHRHDRLVLVAELGAAVFPPLRAAATRIRFAVERWADETAARHCGDRRLVAATLGKVALHGTRPRIVTGFASFGTVARARALLEPPRRRPSRPVMAAIWIILTFAALLTVVQIHHLHELVGLLHQH
jgi:Zn-dependent protease with chaperone function